MSAIAYISGAHRARQWAVDGRTLAGRAYLLGNQLLAVVVLLLLSPLLVAIACCIWLSDGAPILFTHYRVGIEGKLFKCFKFRTMRMDADRLLSELLDADPAARAEWDRDQKLLHDPRISRIGQVLRKTSLDELPQLLNVLRREMVFVGPRPITVSELSRYGDLRWHYLTLRPGITGLWQVSGRNETTYDERVDLDRRYVERRSSRMDLSILLRTVVVVITGHGAR